MPTSRVFRRLRVPDASPSSPSPRHSLPHHPFSSTTSNARHFLYAPLALDLSSPALASSLPPTSALALPPTTTLEHARPFSPSPPLPTPPSCRWLVDLARRLLLGWAVLFPAPAISQLLPARHCSPHPPLPPPPPPIHHHHHTASFSPSPPRHLPPTAHHHRTRSLSPPRARLCRVVVSELLAAP